MPPNFARGTWKLVEDGIQAYMQERGCKPAALILHPRHAKTLFREIPADATLLDDVSVLISPASRCRFSRTRRATRSNCSPIT